MSPRPLPSSDNKLDAHCRSQLSALIDGELSSDQARFLLRRIERDDELAACQERWQLIGDALRGQAVAPAPLDFATRVRDAIQTPPAAQVASVPAKPPARVSWARWGGAALAASVALFAVVISRPTPTPQAAPVFASQAQLPALPEAGVEAAAVAAAAAPAPAVRQVASVPVSNARALPSARGSATRTQQASRASAPREAPPQQALAMTAKAVDPFAQPEHVLQARPWPRSTPVQNALPQRVFNASAPAASAFYPFEPQMPAAAEGSAAH